MRLSRFLAMSLLIVTVLFTMSLFAQAPNTTLKHREKCAEGQTCKCGNPPIDIKVGCECQIDSIGGTGTQHCPLSTGLQSTTGLVIAGLGGVFLGAALTYLLMRRRG